jgi:hypothetical protein
VRSLIGGLLLLPALAVSTLAGPGNGKMFCGEEFASVEGLEAIIKSKPGVKVLPSDASVVSYTDPTTSFIWNFATEANEFFVSHAASSPKSMGHCVATDLRGPKAAWTAGGA